MQENFQDKLLQELSRLVDPLITAANDTEHRNQLFRELGWDLEAVDSSAISSLSSVLSTISSAYTTFTTAILTPPQSISDFTTLLNTAEQLFDAIKQLKTLSGANVLNEFTNLGKDITEYLVVHYLEYSQPVLFQILVCFGLIKHKEDDQADEYLFDPVISKISRYSTPRHRLQLGNISSLLNDPENFLKQQYLIPLSGNWPNQAASSASAKVLFTRLARLLGTLGVNTSAGFNTADGSTFGTTGDAMMGDTMTITLTPENTTTVLGLIFSLSPADRGDLGLVISPYGAATFDETIGQWNLSVTLSASIPGFAIGHYGFEFPTSFGDGRIGAELDMYKRPDANGLSFLIGSVTGTHLEIGQVEVLGSFELSDALREIMLGLKLHKGALVIAPGDGDSFLQKVLPANGIRSEFDLAVFWSNISGFHFEGSGGLELKLPIHKTLLNTLTIDSVTFSLKASSDVKIQLGVTGTLEIGPFKATFEEVGLSTNLTFPAERDGNLGAVNTDLSFKPPTGLGLTFKTETIKGGGFLSFDKDKGRYTGALELSIKDKISLKAIGILTTKLPNGQPGYSLLLLITAEFQPIQLGFGFTLNGVGGLIALHRRMNLQSLRDGVRNGSLDNILFPNDPVGNINSIISTLDNTFPVQEGRYTFGPMFILGWGTPTLITAEIGLFIEVPDPVKLALVGIIKALLPDENKQLLKLQINFVGTIDFEKKFITFDASLFDSRLLSFTLSGDMAFRMRWGDDPTFLLTVGGFHPSFPVPPLNLPQLNRLSISLLGGENPRLTISTYFAVTSNTVQFGAGVEFYWKVSGKLNIDGGLGFDALFQFSPFHFTTSIHGHLSINWKGKCLFGIWFEGNLEGPTPWHISGSVSFKILCFHFDVNFDKTFGNHETTTLSDIDVCPKLMAALTDPTNWQATLPANVPLHVTVRDLPVVPGTVVVHPQGNLGVSQKVVPLDLTISKFGKQRPKDFHKFSLDIGLTNSPSSILPDTPVREYFAPNEFLDRNDNQRLSDKSFEQYNSGVKVQITANDLTSGGYRELTQEYEEIVMDSRYKPVKSLNTATISAMMNKAFLSNNAIANSPRAARQKAASYTAPASVQVQRGDFAIAQAHDLALYNSMTASTEAEAQVMLQELVAAQPYLEGKLNVVHSFELA